MEYSYRDRLGWTYLPKSKNLDIPRQAKKADGKVTVWVNHEDAEDYVTDVPLYAVADGGNVIDLR